MSQDNKYLKFLNEVTNCNQKVFILMWGNNRK